MILVDFSARLQSAYRDGAGAKALAFFVGSAESVIEHGKSKGMPVADCY